MKKQTHNAALTGSYVQQDVRDRGGVELMYFTSQIWSDINDEDQEIRQQADSKWEENARAYWERFEHHVKKRLPQRVSQFHSEVGFHDSELTGVDISHGEYGKKHPVTVTIHLFMNNVKWLIQYKNVQKLSFDYCLSANTLRGIDDWGYDEFLDVDHRIISHEILFASGTTLLIHFPDENISIKKLVS